MLRSLCIGAVVGVLAWGCESGSSASASTDAAATGGDRSGDPNGVDPDSLPGGTLWVMNASGAAEGSFQGKVAGAGGPTDGSVVVLTLATLNGGASIILSVPAERGATGTFQATGQITVDGVDYQTDPPGAEEASIEVTLTEWVEPSLPTDDAEPMGSFSGTLGYVDGEAVDPPLTVSGAFDASASPF